LGAIPPRGRDPGIRPFLLGLLLLGVAAGAGLRPAEGQGPGPETRLARLLERAKAYCRKLENASLDFTCIEKIEEKLYRPSEILPDILVSNPASAGRASYGYATPRQNYYVHTYVYDYQFVRVGERRTERRRVIEEDGRKKKPDDAVLETETIRVENALFGPIGLFGESWQSRHDYRIVGEETLSGKKVVIIEVVPKPGLDAPHCFGRAWVREDDAGTVKIAWDQTSVGNYRAIEARAMFYEAEPKLASVTEYGMEKNGLRFPSRDTTEEAYVKNGKTFVLSRTTIVYRDYKFFTVETEVHYGPSGPRASPPGRPPGVR
jgi:hypothetical protein